MSANTVGRDLREALARETVDADAPRRWLFAIGATLVLVGLAHAIPAVATDRPWAGPVSFRKPLLFGISFGLSCVTIAWFLGSMRVSRRARWLVVAALGGGSIVEVAAVSLQAFRGVPSHFNIHTGPFNEAVFNTMGVAIGFVASAILLVTLWSFVRMEADVGRPFALAVRAGLVVLVVSQALGAQMIVHGLEQVTTGTGQAPNVFGAAGVLKVPHAVTIHAVQVLPAIAWVLALGAWPVDRQRRIVGLAIAGYAGLVLVAAIQTFGGRAPLDLGPSTGAVLVVSGAALGTALGLTGVALLRERSAPRASFRVTPR